jgi:hypothetical protein
MLVALTVSATGSVSFNKLAVNSKEMRGLPNKVGLVGCQRRSSLE